MNRRPPVPSQPDPSAAVARPTASGPARPHHPAARRVARLGVVCLLVAGAARAAPPIPEDLGALPARVADTGLSQGLWVWKDTVVATQAQRTRLLDFCVQVQFNRLALGVYFEDEAAADLRIRRADGLELLLAAAGERGVTVSALRGARDMALRENQARTLRQLDALLAWNAAQPEGARLVDVHYDIEPYLTDAWRAGGDARRQAQVDYLDFLHAARDRVDACPVPVTLSADIPHWWDKAELVLEYGGQVQAFSAHVQDITDYVTLMSYHRDPSRVLEEVAPEAAVARALGKHVNAVMETTFVRGEEHFISFQWLPVWRFWQARYRIEEDARRWQGIGGVWVHHYGSLYYKLNGEAPY